MGTNEIPREVWTGGDRYEPYVGRWSRLVAREFLHWLALPQGGQWLDVGCGTGALSLTILEMTNPERLLGVDRAEPYLEFARGRIHDPRALFQTGDARILPVQSETYDAAVSGLVLNFVPQPDQMIAEMVRAVRKDGTVGLYVWDYAGKMQFMRHFWNAAAALDPAASDLDEGRRFSVCSPAALTDLFRKADLSSIQVSPIDIETTFQDFDDYWNPFLGGQGSAPGYAMSLSEEQRARLRERIYASLPYAVDGSIPLVARAWAVRGIK